MQGFTVSSQLSRLAALIDLFLFLVFLPALTATPVLAQASVITLAMIRYDQSPARTPAVAHNDTTANLPENTSVPRIQYQITGLQFDHQSSTGFLSGFLFERQNSFSPYEQSLFIHKKPNEDGRTGSWVHVEAGYGHFCQFESSLGDNLWEVEQPSCAYLKAGFSF